jgi:MFS family permease
VKRLLEMLRGERRARAFLLTYAQSALGNGMAIVGLLVIAYDRQPSPWAITVVLLAYDLPPGFLGPLAGALVDRVSRRWCVVASDLIRAGAFAGIALVDGIEATIAFTFLAGAATALYSPAALASLPSLVERERLPAVTSLYGGITDAGRTIGPALAAALFPLVGADGVMLLNGATFAISALVLSVIPFGAAVAAEVPAQARSFMWEVREGLRETTRLPLVRIVVIASTLVILFAAMLNVAELPLAHELGVGASGFALLLTAQGVGVVVGSLSGSRRGGLGEYKARYAVGALAVALGLIALSVLPWFVAALVAFVVFGVGNGVLVVHERLIFQVTVPERLTGRAYAMLDALGAWAFCLAYVIAGFLVTLIGTRASIAVAGAGALATWLLAATKLRHARAAPVADTADPYLAAEPRGAASES